MLSLWFNAGYHTILTIKWFIIRFRWICIIIKIHNNIEEYCKVKKEQDNQKEEILNKLVNEIKKQDDEIKEMKKLVKKDSDEINKLKKQIKKYA